MEININRKQMGKIAGAACVATGVVAMSALAASGAAVGAIMEGFKSTISTMKNILNEQKQDELKKNEADSLDENQSLNGRKLK